MHPLRSHHRSRRLHTALAGMLLALQRRAPTPGRPSRPTTPIPVEYRHFEMYAFELSDSTGKNAGTVVEYRPTRSTTASSPTCSCISSSADCGFGTEWRTDQLRARRHRDGCQIRVVKETKRVPEVGIFPFVEAPTGNADKDWVWARPGIAFRCGAEELGPQRPAVDQLWRRRRGRSCADGYKTTTFAGWLVSGRFRRSGRWAVNSSARRRGRGPPQHPRFHPSRPRRHLPSSRRLRLLFAAAAASYGQPNLHLPLALLDLGRRMPSGPNDQDAPIRAQTARRDEAALELILFEGLRAHSRRAQPTTV